MGLPLGNGTSCGDAQVRCAERAKRLERIAGDRLETVLDANCVPRDRRQVEAIGLESAFHRFTVLLRELSDDIAKGLKMTQQSHDFFEVHGGMDVEHPAAEVGLSVWMNG